MISLSSHHVRAPQREPLDLRAISTKFNIVSTQDSSAQFQFGSLCVLATFSGPTEVRIRDELTDRATLQVGFTPLNGVPGIGSSSFSQSLRSLFSPLLLLHHHPRTLLSLHLQVLSSSSAPISSSYHSSLSSTAPIRRARKGGARAAPTTISTEEARSAPLPLASTRARAPHPDAPPTPAEKAASINAIQLALLAGGPVIGARAVVAACSCAVVLSRDARRLRPSGTRRNGMRAGEADGVDEDDDDGDATMSEGDSRQGAQTRPNTSILLDPTPAEEVVALSIHVLAFAFFGKTVREAATEGQEDVGEANMQLDSDDDLDDQLVYADSTGRIGLDEVSGAPGVSGGLLLTSDHALNSTTMSIRSVDPGRLPSITTCAGLWPVM